MKKKIIILTIAVLIITNFIALSLYNYQNDISERLTNKLIEMENHINKQDKYIKYLESLKSKELKEARFTYLDKEFENHLKGLPENYNISEDEIPPNYVSYQESQIGFYNWYRSLPNNILTKIMIACF